MSELLKIDFDKGVLKTPEHTYHIVDSLSVDKYQEFLVLQNEVAYGHTFMEINNKHKEIYEALNKTDFVRAAAILHNLMNSIVSGIDKRSLPIMRLCCLFLIREDEDPTKYDVQLNKEKMDDWKAVDFKDFFHLGAVLVPGLLTALDEISQSILQTEQGLRDRLEQPPKSTSGKQKSKRANTGNG